MKEQDLIDLGFERHDEDGMSYSEDSIAVSAAPDYYYYYYRIVDGLGLISCESESVKEGNWTVEIFDTDPEILFTSREEVVEFLEMIRKRIVKKDKK